jgi:hypothetical protein
MSVAPSIAASGADANDQEQPSPNTEDKQLTFRRRRLSLPLHNLAADLSEDTMQKKAADEAHFRASVN